MKKAIASCFLFAACFSLVGCATWMNGPTEAFNLQTNPSGADCAIGEVLVRTPATAVIDRTDKAVQIVCSKDGYASKTVELKRRQSSWIFGNIFLGVLPGVIADSITNGDSYHEPAIVKIELAAAK